MTDNESIVNEVADYNIKAYIEKHGKSTESLYRKQIIEYFGFPEDTPFFLNRIS